MRWKTGEVRNLLSSLSCHILEEPPGGDVDTTNLVITAKKAKAGNHLHLCGFITSGTIADPDDADVEMLELHDGQDSGGGLVTTDKATGTLYLEARRILMGTGFQVVDKLDEQFNLSQKKIEDL